MCKHCEVCIAYYAVCTNIHGVGKDCQTIRPYKEPRMPDAIKKAEPELTESEWVSLNVATQLLSLNREAVLRLGVEGRLTISRADRWTLVSRASIARYLSGE